MAILGVTVAVPAVWAICICAAIACIDGLELVGPVNFTTEK